MKIFYLILVIVPIFLFADIEKIKTIRGKTIKIKIIRDVNKARLVDIKDYIPDAIVDLRYAKRSRISKRSLYKSNTCLVNKYLAKRLRKINNRLKRKYKKRLKFWDCYRPWSVQKRKWKRFHNKKFIEHPSSRSKYNTGRAVDVTLVDLKGKYIKMPTKYDHFSKKTYHKYKRLHKKIKKNRKILKKTMRRYGLSSNKAKWWSYSLRSRKRYPAYDFTIRDYVKKIEKQKRARVFRNNNKKNRDTSSISFNKKNKNNNRNLSQEIISKIRSIQNPIINCFVVESNKGNDIPSELIISYTVRKNGRFYNITLQDKRYKNKKNDINYCILKAFNKIKIKRISSPIVGRFPLEFSFE